MQPTTFPILVADDDEEDLDLLERAFARTRVANPVHVVRDGEQLLAYLRQVDPYTPATAPRPGLLLLDINMPRMSGLEALAELKDDPDLCRIPVVVLTSSDAEPDVLEAYELGAASYVVKPVTFPGLLEAVERVNDYWVGLVRMPTVEGG